MIEDKNIKQTYKVERNSREERTGNAKPLQCGPIPAVLNTKKANKRIRIFHTRVKLRY